MAKNLVIVESPAKAKTLKKYLGKDFEILASYGHVRDLIPKEGAVDIDNDFAMHYQIIERNAKHVDAICKALKTADSLFLATDPDREGEAISWHLSELIKQKKGLKGKIIKRVAFHEITKVAVQEAIKNPRDLSMELIHAQQARRGLDYLVGFNLSPLLWKKIRRGLSAGRVQSPALRMIVEREIEIEKFEAKEYWTIEADLTAKENAKEKKFTAKLIEHKQEKVKQFSITNKEQAQEVKKYLEDIAKGKLKVDKVTKSQRKRNPAAPFTTSTLQQEAVRKLGFSAKKTMIIAQQLYEGIDIGDGAVGLISYMRTDSVNLAEEALRDIRELIKQRYSPDDLPSEPRRYKTKAKNAQEAHEAIRPTMINVLPQNIARKVSPDQLKLYTLIWKRTIASQMIHATFDQVTVDFVCGNSKLRANGSVLNNPGFIQVYQEGLDDKQSEDDEKLLPPLKEGDIVDLNKIRAEQHFTEPPPRYSEASLVKTLEEHGIGRPSTYASIISTLQTREYVILDKKRFIPTDVGRVVNKFLTNYFANYVDYNFTAKLEDDLDAVARGEKSWLPLMQEFWQPFINLIKDTEQNVQRKDVTQEALDEDCPKCGKPLSIRLGRRGRFVGCTAYPDCDYTRNLDPDAKAEEEKIEGRKCPECSSDLLIRYGKYGKFIGCSGYPSCKYIESLNKPVDTGVVCPKCKSNNILKRKTRRNTYFYACGGYPKCEYAIKHPPISKPCPSCSWPILTVKTTKRKGTELLCPQKDCNHTIPCDESVIPNY